MSVEQALATRVQDKRLQFSLYDESLALDGIPKEIGAMVYLEELTITGAEGWIVYPPLSALKPADLYDHAESINTLPNALLNLRNLQKLEFRNVGLSSLPDEMEKLVSLRTLDLSFNAINLEKELSKIEKLPSLEELIVYGLPVDERHIQRWADSTEIDIHYK